MSARDSIENLWDRAGGVGHLLDAYRAEILREYSKKARNFSDETENAHTWWVVANWLEREAEK